MFFVNQMDLLDTLRELRKTNTQVRQLHILSLIVKKIGKRRVPLEIIKKKVFDWSNRIQYENKDYIKLNGRLTNNNVPTSAFSKYILFAEELGLITTLGGGVANTRLGLLLNVFLLEKNELDYNLIESEKLFFLFILLSKDSNYIILAASIVFEENTINQNDIQNKFKEALILRYKSLQNISKGKTISDISERLRIVSHEWKNAKSYSEHIIIPRLEWLKDLGVIKIQKDSSKTTYTLTDKGVDFMYRLLNYNNLLYINQNWLLDNSFKAFSMLHGTNQYVLWNELSPDLKTTLVGPILHDSYQKFSEGKALRIATFPTLLYTTINLIINKNVVVEFKELLEMLSNNLKYYKYTYHLKSAARENEGYISIIIENEI